LALLLSDACGKQINANHVVIAKSHALLEKRREMVKLNAILTRIKGVLEQSGDFGFSKLLNEMRFIITNLQQHYVELISLRNEFFEAFIKLESNSHHFKVKRLQNAYQRLDDNGMRSEMINLLALTENISMSDLSKQVEESVQASINSVKREVEGLRGYEAVSTTPCSFEEKVIKMQQAEDSVEMLRIQRLEGQVLSLCSELGSQLTQNEDSQATITGLKKTVGELEINNVGLKADNIGLKAELELLERGISMKLAVSQQKEEKSKEDKSEEERSKNALRTLSSTFTYFIDQYLNQKRSGFGFWHRHGETGKEMAKKVMRTWENERLKMAAHLFDASPKNILAEGAQMLLGSLTALMASDEITGNFHKHSLKTYMLGYYSYLKNFCDSGPNAVVQDPNVAFHHHDGNLPSSKDYQASGAKKRWNAIVEAYRNPAVSLASSVVPEASASDEEGFFAEPPRRSRA
ncbi:MAG: hypothetical protein ACYC0J_10235, partial [Gammaproteobacteria bacterium]